MIYDDRLEDLVGNILSIAIYDLIPSLIGNRIKNKLIDGTMHVQNIGEPTKYISFECASGFDNMNKINEIDFSGQPIKVFFDNKYYVGLIDNLDQWRIKLFGEFDSRLYSANITVAVSEEGSI